MGSHATKAKTLKRSNGAPAAPEPQAQVNVILADSQSIYRVGIRKIFALEDDIRVVAQAETFEQTIAAAAKHNADVLLFQASISQYPAEAVSEILKQSPECKIVVVLSDASEQNTVDLLKRGARGICPRSISPDLLVRCVRKVASGETWLDNKAVNWMIEAYRAQAEQLTSPRPKTRISEKELHIISCVTQGMRNKEIAVEIGTTEQVIKNYLRKVYDKLGVSDRLELALYCIHHRLLADRPQTAARQSQPQPPANAQPAAVPASAGMGK